MVRGRLGATKCKVNNEFAVSSTATERFPVMDNIKDMFDKVREVSGHDTTEAL